MFTTSPSIIDPFVHTYSIVARDPHTGQIGVAVQSHYFAVGSTVPWAEAGVGAVATQAFANMDYGPEGLTLMRQGLDAEQALETLLKHDEGREIPPGRPGGRTRRCRRSHWQQMHSCCRTSSRR